MAADQCISHAGGEGRGHRIRQWHSHTPDAYAYPTSIALTSADEQRFTEQPEQLDQLDSSLFRTIVLIINDATASALEKSCNGSGIRLLTHLHDLRARRTDEPLDEWFLHPR